MNKIHNPIPASLKRRLTKIRAEKRSLPSPKKHGLLANTIFEAPTGYKYSGRIVVENWLEVENTVPENVYQMAGFSDDIIIKLQSETIVENGRVVKDRIVAEFFEWDIRQFRCV